MKIGEIDAFAISPISALKPPVTASPHFRYYFSTSGSSVRASGIFQDFISLKPKAQKAKISCLTNFLLFFFHLFDQTHQALNLWLWGGKDSVQLLLGVMFMQ
jgi:hypothetical protein